MEEEKKDWTFAPVLVVVVLCVDAGFVYANYQAFAPCDGHFTLGLVRMIWGILMMCFGLLVMLALVRHAVLGATGSQSWRPAIEYLVLGVTTSLAIFGGVAVADAAIGVQLERFVERSKPLVAALESYQAKHGEAASSLDDLVPGAIEKIPDDGICASTGFDYRTAKDGSTWSLRLPIDVDAIEPIYLLYEPGHDYSHVPVMERYGDWAYVHE